MVEVEAEGGFNWEEDEITDAQLVDVYEEALREDGPSRRPDTDPYRAPPICRFALKRRHYSQYVGGVSS